MGGEEPKNIDGSRPNGTGENDWRGARAVGTKNCIQEDWDMYNVQKATQPRKDGWC